MAGRQFFEVRISRPAFEDIAEIWDWTVERFGHAAALRYEDLIDQAIADLARDPQRPGAKIRPDLLPSLWIYHLAFSRANAGDEPTAKSPCHFVIFRIVDSNVLEIVRLLHDSRDLVRHLPFDLKAE